MIYIVIMKEEYDFSQSIKNPYINKLKKQVTIRLEEDVVDYFRVLAEETGISYQSLINLYLQDCVRLQRKPSLEWMSNA
ncbi:BrnA antitoxin family protein [Nostoc sp. 'Peltigera membranacea cyanobiont' N6]|uniref:BrnA antitoxin family protein n=2 Tax=Nostoc TaxID=1177 RepID=UPI002157F299|nr:BrnA antitoxin family protein [Nostoc sp. 'Peltigera membranacea cyanobiont' N6]